MPGSERVSATGTPADLAASMAWRAAAAVVGEPQR